MAFEETGRRRCAVLLAACAGEMFLRQQVESIVAQQECDLSVFISVDPCRDNTLALASALCARYENVSLIAGRNASRGSADNFFFLIRSVDLNGFDYLALSDQDDIWYPDKLQKAISVLGRNPDLGGYSSNVLAFYADGCEELLVKSQRQTEFDHLFQSAGPGCTYVLKKEPALLLQRFLLRRGSALDAVEYHDWLIYAFVRGVLGRGWYIDSSPTLRYRQHENNVIGINKGFAARAYRLKLLLNGWYRSQVGSIVEFVGKDRKKILSPSFILPNLLKLRRKKLDSLLIGLGLMLGLL